MTDIPTPDVVALVRRRYVEGATVRSISAESGLRSNDILYRCLAGEYDDGSGILPAPIARRRQRVNAHGSKDGRTALVTRLWRAAGRQVRQIEKAMKAAGIDAAEHESNARSIAVVARTLRDLSAFDAANRSRGKETMKDDDDEPAPRNVEDLRRALARKLEAFVAGRENPVSGDAE